MNFTHSILQQMGYKLDPDGNYSRTETNTPRVSDAKPKPVARKTLQNKLINCDMLESFLMTIPDQQKSSLTKSKLKTRRKNAPKLKSKSCKK